MHLGPRMGTIPHILTCKLWNFFFFKLWIILDSLSKWGRAPSAGCDAEGRPDDR